MIYATIKQMSPEEKNNYWIQILYIWILYFLLKSWIIINSLCLCITRSEKDAEVLNSQYLSFIRKKFTNLNRTIPNWAWQGWWLRRKESRYIRSGIHGLRYQSFNQPKTKQTKMNSFVSSTPHLELTCWLLHIRH